MPTENIKDNKIYLTPNGSSEEHNVFDEYVYDSESKTWELLGQHTEEIDLSPYLTKTDADKTYLKILKSTTTSANIDSKGAFGIFADNGQAFLAVRQRNKKPSIIVH